MVRSSAVEQDDRGPGTDGGRVQEHSVVGAVAELAQSAPLAQRAISRRMRTAMEVATSQNSAAMP